MAILAQIFFLILVLFEVLYSPCYTAPTSIFFTWNSSFTCFINWMVRFPIVTQASTSRIDADVYTDALSCSVCLELFREPRMLPCGHTNCTECLQQLQHSNDYGFIQCAQCRAECPLPVQMLPVNYVVKGFFFLFKI